MTVDSGPLLRLPRVLIGAAALFLYLFSPAFFTAPCVAAGPLDTLKIGVLAPLSGPFAAGGTSFVQAATLAVEQANGEGGVFGHRVTIVVGDTQGRVDVAKAEALRLVSREKVSALVGAYLSEETVGVMEVAAAERIVLLVPVAATAEITDKVRQEYDRYRYVFRVGYSLPQWAEMIAAFLSDRKVRRYAFVGAGIRWNLELGERLERIVVPRGIAPVYTAFYSPGNPAFDTVAVAAAAASPDIVILADPGRNSVSFLKRLRESAPALPALSIGGSLGDARLANSVPLSAPVYVQTAAWRGVSPAATAYVERYEHRYGTPPVGYSDTLPFDAVTVLVAAWRRAGSVASGAVVPVLERGAFEGAAGTYRFDAAHQAYWGTGPGALRGTFVRWERGGARIVFPPR
ncbi:MAG: branched-chain amino acid transporter substrate-binding protein [Deltaproteobacteria bacterium]|nr:branched-chain amino acid transporter substrate-binding protein [Deltaproteobacteria bacterium]